MSQRDFLRRFDAMAFGAFAAAGVGDAAHYYAPGSEVAVACTVLVDRNVRDFGDDLAPVSTAYTRITFQRAEVEPEQGARVALLDAVAVEVESFALAARIETSDESASRWVVAADA